MFVENGTQGRSHRTGWTGRTPIPHVASPESFVLSLAEFCPVTTRVLCYAPVTKKRGFYGLDYINTGSQLALLPCMDSNTKNSYLDMCKKAVSTDIFQQGLESVSVLQDATFSGHSLLGLLSFSS